VNQVKQTLTHVLGYLLMVTFAAHSVLLTILPRTDKTSVLRETLRGYHYLLGTLLFLWGVALLWQLLKHERSVNPAHFERWTRLQSLALLLLLLAAAVLGPLQAWADGMPVHFANWLALPALVAEDRGLWMFAGYFHSAIGFALLLLSLSMACTGIYGLFRYGRGLIAAFPPGLGLLALISLGVSVYAMTTFQSPEPGPKAVGTYVGLALLVMGLAKVLSSKRAASPKIASTPLGAMIQGGLLIGLLAFGMYLPHLMFRVTPWPVGEVVVAPANVTYHSAPVVDVVITPSTAFETDVAMETYKWCRFCHTVDKGEAPLVGPNLFAIFGQQAATVPNFYYSPALAQAGRDGLVWTGEALDKFLADPDGFMPGTSMIISSGPVTDPEIRKAVINMLKRETMSTQSPK
jgi:cytochrome c2